HRVEVIALEVLDERVQRHLLVGDLELLLDCNGRVLRAVGVAGAFLQEPKRGESAVAGDDLKPLADASDRDGLKQSVPSNGRRELVERALVHRGSGLERVVVEELESDGRCDAVDRGRRGGRWNLTRSERRL